MRLPALTSSLLLALLLAMPLGAQPITVTPQGPSLAEAVAQVAPYGTIRVEPGAYEADHVVIDKPGVTIEGVGQPTIDAGGEALFFIEADSVTLRGLHLRNVETSYVEDRAAIRVNAHYCTLEANSITDTFFAIYLAQSGHCRIIDNVITGIETKESRAANGIHLWYSRYVTISGNTIRRHRDGIYLEFVEDSEVMDNHSEGNLRYGLHFMFSDRCAYRRNRLIANDAGVAVMYTKNVTMEGNTFADNWGSASFGLLLKDITDSQIVGNTFRRNTIGIYAEGSDRMIVTGNDFVQNGWALKVFGNTHDNSFTANTFIANTFDVATNSSLNENTFADNYWDKYQGYDLDRDGVGDVPFRPVRLFSHLVEQNEPALILLRSFFVDLLDAAERVLPVITPESLIDETPRMRPEKPPASHTNVIPSEAEGSPKASSQADGDLSTHGACPQPRLGVRSR